VVASRSGDSVSLRSRDGSGVTFAVRVTTTGKALTPLSRAQIFTPEFLAFLDAARAAGNATAGTASASALRARWLERQTRGVELLSSREKLMAGLPAYATYFGRDMLVSALMMRPIWRDEMSEFVIASVLRKLSPSGQVSHEEALGGQAVREGASEYAALVSEHLGAVKAANRSRADTLLVHARAVLRDLRRTRENYHMIDDELQLPVLAARWLADPNVPAQRKRAFLNDSSDGGGTRLARLLRELALVSRMTAAYAANPVATNLVSFPQADSGRWSSASWRDSGDGYAGGRFAMDVNAIWAPHALESIERIITALDALGIRADALHIVEAQSTSDSPLGRYVRDTAALRRASSTWQGAWQHFVVRLGPAEVSARVAARLAALPAPERAYWEARGGAERDSLEFLALSLDAGGRPIAVANTDPSTRLFLGEHEGERRHDSSANESVLRDVRLFARPYPVGLLIDRVGPVVANDAYASPSIWPAFERDRYHGPRVVWGREVNLFLLGVAGRIAAANDSSDPATASFVRDLRASLNGVLAAVEGSGFHSELWSYEIQNGRLIPIRYGTGSDVQLWSTTYLAVQFALSQLKP
jgi:hypothetical protein